MAHKEITPSDVRKDVAKNRSGNIGNGNSRRGGNRKLPNLRGHGRFTDEELRKEINRNSREVGDHTATEIIRYYTYLRVSLMLEGKNPPSSISHARRYGYEQQQHKFWRDRMIRALDKS